MLTSTNAHLSDRLYARDIADDRKALTLLAKLTLGLGKLIAFAGQLLGILIEGLPFGGGTLTCSREGVAIDRNSSMLAGAGRRRASRSSASRWGVGLHAQLLNLLGESIGLQRAGYRGLQCPGIARGGGSVELLAGSLKGDLGVFDIRAGVVAAALQPAIALG